MTETKISITIKQLESLLFQQKQITADYLLGNTYYYNTESLEGDLKYIANIDKEKFKETANKSKYPQDLETLKKYLPNE